ncbi:PA26 p53-induced protein-domain-containing protein [Syncephalis plumigaleata]|nr:PA26 p53-induced protein-domain-containing protein [Syncephalis plumigaleata]
MSWNTNLLTAQLLCDTSATKRASDPVIDARRIAGIRMRTALFNPLLTRDVEQRRQTLRSIGRFVKTLARVAYPADAPGTLASHRSSISSVNDAAQTNTTTSSPYGEDTPQSPDSTQDVELSTSPEAASGMLSSEAADIPLRPRARAHSRHESWTVPMSPLLDDEDVLRRMVQLPACYLYKQILLTIIRLSVDCPFEDVRRSFTELLEKLKMTKMPVYTPVRCLPSFFITASQTPSFLDDADDNEANYGVSRTSISTETESSAPTQLKRNRSSSGASAHIRRLIVDTFLTYGRLSHTFRLLSFFPGYMERFHKAYSTIVRHPSGPLPRSWRYYIGIMAAAQHSCQYLIFLQAGGDPTWINGIGHAPGKLRRLVTLNTILAHQPWRLTPAHIGALVKADAEEDTFPAPASASASAGSHSPVSENWSMGEIVHAIVLLSTFHGLASFALSCGLVPELDTLGGTEEMDDILMPSTYEAEVVETEDQAQMRFSMIIKQAKYYIMISMKAPKDWASSGTKKTSSAFEECAAVETFKSADPANIASDDEHAMSASNTASSLPPPSPTGTGSTLTYMSITSIRLNPVIDDMSRFLHPPIELRHVDFDVKSDEYSVFRLQDYCWEDHGVELVDQFLRGVGDLLDEEFKEAQTITDFSFSTQTALLDTWPLRQAIWYYVLRLAGLSHDDYDYAHVNRFLNRRLKQYVKKVACYPEELDARDFVHFGFVLRAEEKCHINLLVSVARKQAALVYGLYNVMRWSDKGR